MRELPPLPLAFFTASSLGFLTAGVAAGAFAIVASRGWWRVLGATLTAAVTALLLCAVTRTAGLFPTGNGGWELVFEPLASALIAIPAACGLSLALLFLKR